MPKGVSRFTGLSLRTEWGGKGAYLPYIRPLAFDCGEKNTIVR
jgi:hypothetical protein